MTTLKNGVLLLAVAMKADGTSSRPFELFIPASVWPQCEVALTEDDVEPF